MSDTRITQERRTPPYTPHAETCRETTEHFLNDLAENGVDPAGRSAYWWVGCLATQLEYLLAATDPERAK